MAVKVLEATLARDIVRDCLCGMGQVMPSKHFRDELEAEALSIPDAWHVLRTGNIFDPPEQDISTGEWKYRMEGRTQDGIWLAIVFCFKAANRAHLITVFSEKDGGSR